MKQRSGRLREPAPRIGPGAALRLGALCSRRPPEPPVPGGRSLASCLRPVPSLCSSRAKEYVLFGCGRIIPRDLSRGLSENLRSLGASF